MTALPVVPDLEVLEDRVSQLEAGVPLRAVVELELHARLERLGHGARRRLRHHHRLRDAVDDIPAVLQAQRLFGEPDYLLRMITADLAAFSATTQQDHCSTRDVQQLSSTLVMKNVTNHDLPLHRGGRTSLSRPVTL